MTEFDRRLREKNYPRLHDRGDDYWTFCPVHETSGGHDPSAHVSVDQGRVLAFCFTCDRSVYPEFTSGALTECTATHRPKWTGRCGAGGLSHQDLLWEREIRSDNDYRSWSDQEGDPDLPSVAAVYRYGDDAAKVRWASGADPGWRHLRWYRRGDGGWRRGTDSLSRSVPLYGAETLATGPPVAPGVTSVPETDTQDPVYAVEGEKDVDRLRGLGLDAVSHHYVGDLTDERLAPLTGRHVVVLRDADEPGAARARSFAGRVATVAASVIAAPAFSQPDGGENRRGYDVSDWLDDGNDVKALRAFVERTGEVVQTAVTGDEETAMTGDAASGEDRLTDALRRFAPGLEHDDGLRRDAELARRRSITRRVGDALADEAALPPEPRHRCTASEYAALPQPAVVMADVLPAAPTLLGGPDSAGKSLQARDWALCVATGTPWRGHLVPEARAVLYVMDEGMHDFGDRWSTEPLWIAARDQTFVVDQPVNLLSPRDVGALIDEYADLRPGLTIFDTIYGMGMPDDTGTKDVSPVIAAMKRISQSWGGATLAIGHAGHNGARRFRGSSMWRQRTDAEWHMAEGSLTCERSKVADRRTLRFSYELDYPRVRFLDGGAAFSREVQRRTAIAEDLRTRPNDSDSARAKRLAGPLGVAERTARDLIKRHRTETEEPDGEA